ncbi:MAG: TenA family protein [Desulfuromonadaceae bacterium]|nr:TenA family protein [Desulfuromonadaceae bacterium]
MSLAANLWRENHELALASLNNPFVQGIGDGSLDRRRFSYYVSQDAFFLRAFARAYVIAGAKAPDWEDFIQLHELAAGVFGELKLHTKYARQWGVDLVHVQAAGATRRYTDFVMATAWGHDTGMTVTALTPCMRLYAWLGQQLAATEPAPHLYSDWILTYNGEEIESLARQLEALVDKYAADSPQVRAVYRYAMECERDFFQAAFDSLSA